METLIQKIKDKPNEITFQEVINYIDSTYNFTPTKFKNGEIINEAGQNSGSCKLFSYAKIVNLSKAETLACFGDYYRKDVLKNLEGTDHENIRNFIKYGLEGIIFYDSPLTKK